MSLRINHNIAAFDAHRNLTMTTRSLSGSMEKLSSGFRINRASDDPAGLVISEQFRAQIAGLNRAIENSEGSMNMIQTAEGALTEINNLLVKMRELAIHAANEGFNDTTQLAADQSEIDNSIATIDRIAGNTQFGTKSLLDGTRNNNATITSANQSQMTVKESGLSTGVHSVVATKTADSSATLNSTSLGVSLQTGGTVYNLADGLHNVNVLQASAGATRTGTTVYFQDAFNNKLTLADAATYATIGTAALVGTATAGNAGDYTVVVNYAEVGSNPTGQQTLTITVANGDTIQTVADKWNTQISNNASLNGKIEAVSIGVGAASGTLYFRPVNAGAKYSLQFVSQSNTAVNNTQFSFGTARSTRGASKDVVSMTVTTANLSGSTASLNIVSATTTKTFASMTDLVTDINTALTNAFGLVAVGSVANVVASVDGTDKVKFITSDEGGDYNMAVNSNGTGTSEAEEILGFTAADTVARAGTNALVSFDGYTNEITSVKYNATTNLTLENKAGDATTVGRGTIDITINTAANGINVGDLLLDVDAAKFSVRLDGGPQTEVTAGTDTLIWNSGRSEYLKVNYALTSDGGSEQLSNTDSSLVFQIGANVGQTARVGIRNMTTTQLGKNIAGNMYTSLSQIDVQTVTGAQDAQAVIDEAISEVSSLRGQLGSFQKNTLESNLRNLRISAQNLTASESAIRDTDMASEMSTFVRYQILLQAGTSMLAQANQVPQVVLSLFR
jgi:flagellin